MAGPLLAISLRVLNTCNFEKLAKVRSFKEHSCAILSSFKIMIIFNITSAEIKTKSADVLLKMIVILKDLRIAQWTDFSFESVLQ